jgi:DNA polymerase I-like protein with 3'-5' exonuclease and polymerase domains|tara:strand:+ start:634 stop:2982 length:2349 start_codon:yes stop_codon:yes gene_type:complete
MQLEKKYYTVQDEETLKLLHQHILDSDVIAVDTETTGLNPRKNKIIGWSVSGDEGVGFYLPTLVFDYEKDELVLQEINGKSTEVISKNLIKLLIGKKLVFHNASFDVQFIKNYFGIDLLPSVYVDTGLLVHTVYEEGAFGFGNPFGLKSIAIMNQKELGLDVQEAANKEQIELKESIKKNGGSTTKALYEIFKADLDILSKYASADTDLTLRICNLYLKKLKVEGLEKFFFEDEVMPIYREVTVPMEAHGVDLDMELIEKVHGEIIIDQKKNKEIVMKSLLEISEVKEWIMDTAFKEYPPSHKGNWAQRLAQRYSLNLPKSEKTGKYSITQKHVEALDDSPAKDYLMTGDINVLEELEVARISMAMWKETNDGDYINIQSKKQLGEIVFKYMGITPKVAGSNTKSGRAKFDMDMIKDLSKDYPWAENLRVYNRLLKIKSTYVDRFRDRQEDGRYYFYFKQNGTVSGRYGSDAQQLPKPLEEGEEAPIIMKYVNVVRRFLIAGPGRKVIDADYESLEPHCFASVTGDTALQEIFNKGWDFYSTVAIKTERLNEDKVRFPNGVSADKKADNYLKKLDAPARNKAKAYSLGIAYGMEAYALKMTLGVDQKTAEKLVQGYLDGFPELKAWRENSRLQVKAHGYIKNYVGRVRHLPKVQKTYIKFQDRMMDWRFRKELEVTYGKDIVLQAYRDYRNGLNNCLNFQLQSLAAAVVNRAALKINLKAKELGIDAICQAQVHDQLIVNVDDKDAEMFAPFVQEIMENTTKLPGVTLKAPPEIANNWAEGH